MLKRTDKNCIKCGVALSEANWKRHSRIGYINKCNDCLRAEKRAWIAKWASEHREESARRYRRYKANLRLNDPVRARAKSAYEDCRKRALSHGLPFDLTGKAVLAMMREAIVCPYFGWTLTHATGKAKTLASLDRIDSKRGYTQDNVTVISYLANLMKSSATEAELLAFANGILRVHSAPQPAAYRTVEKVKKNG